MKCQIFLPKLVIVIIILSFSNENLSQEKKFFKEMKPLEKSKAQIKLSEAYQFYSEGNFKNALLDYKDLIVINPSNAKAHFGIASCYYKLHNYKKIHTVECTFKLLYSKTPAVLNFIFFSNVIYLLQGFELFITGSGASLLLRTKISFRNFEVLFCFFAFLY